eukprot:361174-Chlamydomonas_euryale.AAC.1
MPQPCSAAPIPCLGAPVVASGLHARRCRLGRKNASDPIAPVIGPTTGFRPSELGSPSSEMMAAAGRSAKPVARRALALAAMALMLFLLLNSPSATAAVATGRCGGAHSPRPALTDSVKGGEEERGRTRGREDEDWRQASRDAVDARRIRRVALTYRNARA